MVYYTAPASGGRGKLSLDLPGRGVPQPYFATTAEFDALVATREAQRREATGDSTAVAPLAVVDNTKRAVDIDDTTALVVAAGGGTLVAAAATLIALRRRPRFRSRAGPTR